MYISWKKVPTKGLQSLHWSPEFADPQAHILNLSGDTKMPQEYFRVIIFFSSCNYILHFLLQESHQISNELTSSLWFLDWLIVVLASCSTCAPCLASCDLIRLRRTSIIAEKKYIKHLSPRSSIVEYPRCSVFVFEFLLNKFLVQFSREKCFHSCYGI